MRLDIRGSLYSLIVGGLCLYTTTAHSQDLADLSFDELFDIEIIEVASGIAQSLNKAPAIASIIIAEDIQEMGAKTLDDNPTIDRRFSLELAYRY